MGQTYRLPRPFRAEIDNNLTENAIRPTAIGKKNGLFFGSKNSGQTSSIFYTIIETCRKQDINPEEYLRDIFPALPTMPSAEAPVWTPTQWNSRHNALQPKAIAPEVTIME